MKRYIYIFLALTLFAGTVSARSTYNINARWTFFTGNDTDTGTSSVIYLPHTWNSDAVAGSGAGYYRGVGNYMKDVDIPFTWRGKRVFLRIGGAATVTDVIINGRHVADHYGGNSAFTVELTDRLKYGQANKFWIMVNNSPRLDVLPTAGEDNVYGGIFRNVELVVCEPLSVSPAAEGGDGVWITTTRLSADKAEGTVRLDLLDMESVPENARARIRFLDKQERLVAQNSVAIVDLAPGNTGITLPFTVTKPRMWQGTADPYLYDVEVTITRGDVITDSLTVGTGFRTFAVDKQNNFLLNGKPYKLHGVILHRDRMMAGTAMTPFQIEEDVNIIREMGANAIRVAGGQHNDYFYTLCDEAGIIVWNDLPFMGAVYPTDRDFADTPQFRANGRQQLGEMISQLYNHPSIAMWGIFSDVSTRGDDPVPYVRELNTLAHKLDPARLTVASSVQDGDINFVTDLIVFNQSFGWLNGMPDGIVLWMDQLKRNFPQLPAGLSYSAGASIFHQSEKLEKTVVQSNHHPENWQTYFHEQYMKNAVGAPQFWGIFVGNMFDFGAARRTWGDGKGTNDEGLVTFDRKDRKDAFYLYMANWNTTEPFVYITDKRLDTRTSRSQIIKVYSNQPEVELFVGNRSAGKRTGQQGVFTWENVDLKGGINRLEARSELATDRASINVDTSGSATSGAQTGQIRRIANQ